MEDLKEKYPLAIQSINFPVKYDDYGQKIWDSKDNLILDIRGWGRLQYLSEPKERQDQIGKMITEAINNVVKK